MVKGKREYLRLPVKVPFSYNIIEESEKGRIIEEISTGSNICPAFENIESFAKLIMEKHKLQETKEINPVMLEMLLLIMNKLERLEEHLTGSPVNTYKHKGATEDLSGGGFSFITTHSYPVGTFMDVFLDIRMFPKCGIRALGRVVRNEQLQEGRMKYGVGFEFIREEDREDIIKYLFIKQREILAKRRLEKA